MIDIRTIRRSRGLTLTDLAALSGLSARTLAEIEQGLRPINAAQRQDFARILNVPAPQLGARPPEPAAPSLAWPRRAFGALLVICASLLMLATPLFNQPPVAASVRSTPAPRAALAAPQRSATPTLAPTSHPTAMPPPTPTATPRFTLAADGPRGCPLAPGNGSVVMTQGYGVGTHAPADAWGAVDLGIDGDGDGEAEPGSTQGQPISATLGGVAHVYLGSWPGGNYVRVDNMEAGWSSAYAHLDSVTVADNQVVETGALLGTVGSTGMTSGPHLHYEVWHGTQNVDPTNLLGC